MPSKWNSPQEYSHFGCCCFFSRSFNICVQLWIIRILFSYHILLIKILEISFTVTQLRSIPLLASPDLAFNIITILFNINCNDFRYSFYSITPKLNRFQLKFKFSLPIVAIDLTQKIVCTELTAQNGLTSAEISFVINIIFGPSTAAKKVKNIYYYHSNNSKWKQIFRGYIYIYALWNVYSLWGCHFMKNKKHFVLRDFFAGTIIA